MKEIPLTQGKVALVDDEDFDYLNQWKWQAQKSRYTYYAQRAIKLNNKRTKIMMHRLILNVHNLLKTDHINMNGIDNRKENLRICTASENGRNSNSHKNSSSEFKGVHWHKGIKKYVALIRINCNRTHLGCFNSEVSAARAYNEAAKKYHGEFARLNLIPTLTMAGLSTKPRQAGAYKEAFNDQEKTTLLATSE